MNPASAYPPNPFSPRAFQGVQQPVFEDRPFSYIYSPPNGYLTALQTGLVDNVAIDTDSDFLWEAWYISQYTGTFLVQLTDSTGYQLQSGQLQSAGLSQSQADPTVTSPAHLFPAGGKIQLLLTDTSDATNYFQLVFIGVKRYRLSKSIRPSNR